jgi:hypothetical protein
LLLSNCRFQRLRPHAEPSADVNQYWANVRDPVYGKSVRRATVDRA